MNCNQIWGLIVGSGLGSGLVTFWVQKYFEHRFNKKLYRFNKLYSDKLDIIKNLYRLLIQAEKGLDILLSEREPDKTNEKEEFRHKTMETLDKFIDYFEENEIVFDKSIVDLVRPIGDRFDKGKKAHIFANLMESDRGSETWLNAVSKKKDLHEQLVKNEIPILKGKLIVEFQNKYQLLDE